MTDVAVEEEKGGGAVSLSLSPDDLALELLVLAAPRADAVEAEAVGAVG